jgi:hypothetical protein
MKIFWNVWALEVVLCEYRSKNFDQENELKKSILRFNCLLDFFLQNQKLIFFIPKLLLNCIGNIVLLEMFIFVS